MLDRGWGSLAQVPGGGSRGPQPSAGPQDSMAMAPELWTTTDVTTHTQSPGFSLQGNRPQSLPELIHPTPCDLDITEDHMRSLPLLRDSEETHTRTHTHRPNHTLTQCLTSP